MNEPPDQTHHLTLRASALNTVERRRYAAVSYLAVFLSLALPLTSAAAEKTCAPAALLKAVTTIEAPDLPADHFLRQPKTLYRVGERKGRMEEELNVQSGIHLLVVVDEPHLWMVNRAQGQGQYQRDPGPTYYFRARIFSDTAAKSAFIRSFEIGCEIAWMREADIKPKPTKHATLGAVNKFEFSEGAERLVLFERGGKPLRIELYGADGWIMAMNYVSYETNLKADPKLFTKPEGIRFEGTGK